MLSRLVGFTTRLTTRLQRSAYAFPLAVVVAGLMIGISELAFHEADAQLGRLALMDKTRLELMR
ncbi:MAG: hypothetical protein ABI574_00560, partial [Burkholderiales bacterium]